MRRRRPSWREEGATWMRRSRRMVTGVKGARAVERDRRSDLRVVLAVQERVV